MSEQEQTNHPSVIASTVRLRLEALGLDDPEITPAEKRKIANIFLDKAGELLEEADFQDAQLAQEQVRMKMPNTPIRAKNHDTRNTLGFSFIGAAFIGAVLYFNPADKMPEAIQPYAKSWQTTVDKGLNFIRKNIPNPF